MARDLVAAFRVPTRRACGVVQCNRATFYYRSQRRDVTPLRMRLRELAAARPRFGYRRLHVLLHREGWRINHKKTYRLYREEQLGVRVHRRRKRASQVRVRPAAPTRPNERWCMDFMADRLDDGRRIRILTVEDVFTRECLAVEVDTSLVRARVVAVLDRLVQARGALRSCWSTMAPNSTRGRRTAEPTKSGCGWTSAGRGSPWGIRSSRASTAASETST
jgi:putative transposase